MRFDSIILDPRRRLHPTPRGFGALEILQSQRMEFGNMLLMWSNGMGCDVLAVAWVAGLGVAPPGRHTVSMGPAHRQHGVVTVSAQRPYATLGRRVGTSRHRVILA